VRARRPTTRNAPEREQKASITTASKLGVRRVGRMIPDPRLVATMFDPLTFNAHIGETDTEGYELRAPKTGRACW
jgi:hypothetical protein